MDLRQHIRTVPDFPEKGIMFRDVTTLFNNAEASPNMTSQSCNCNVQAENARLVETIEHMVNQIKAKQEAEFAQQKNYIQNILEMNQTTRRIFQQSIKNFQEQKSQHELLTLISASVSYELRNPLNSIKAFIVEKE